MDKGGRTVMDIVAVIPDFKNDFQRLKESYYARYGVMDEISVKEIAETIPDSMKHFSIEFYSEEFIVRNKIKEEVNSYLYDELYKTEKVKDGYLISLNKNQFYFFKFSDFQEEELEKLDEILKKYYLNVSNDLVAVIEDYKWDLNRCITGMKAVYKKMIFRQKVIGLAVIIIIIQVLFKEIFLTIVAAAAFLILVTIMFSFFYYKKTAKKILNSMNKNFLNIRVLFYSDEAEFITKKKLTVSKMKYDEFYKIEKIKEGYIFYTQRYNFYFFWFNEFPKEELEKLDIALSGYISKK